MKTSSLMLGASLLLATLLSGLTTTATTNQGTSDGRPLKSKHATAATRGLHVEQRADCGIERWSVKTLQDPSVKEIHFAPQDSSISALRTPKPPANLRTINPQLRLEQEKQVYRVHALLMGFKVEDDGDFHLVLADPKNQKITMVAEIPKTACANKAYAKQFAAAADFIATVHKPESVGKMFWLKEPMAVTVEGVFFFDFIHGQTGVAPNGAELHPVLAIAESTSRP